MCLTEKSENLVGQLRLPVPPTPVGISSRPFVLELCPLGFGAVLVPDALLVLLQLDPRPARHVERAPDRHQRREEDDHIANDER